MSPRARRSLFSLCLVALLVGPALWHLQRQLAERRLRDPGRVEPPTARLADDADGSWALSGADASAEARAALIAKLRERLNRRHVRGDEAVLTFKDAAAYREFLARAGAAGLTVLGRIDGLLAVRVRIADYDAFVGELVNNSGAYAAVTSNAILAAPAPPTEDRSARSAVPVGDNLLDVLGVRAAEAEWGKGVTIAVLDGGVVPDTTFGTRLRYLDIGYGVSGLGEDAAHGTSVAALAAGAAGDARGVAPSASVLSVRVTGPDGLSDTFSVAQGIFAAVDAGAQIINISLGGYATSSVLGEAVDYALAAGVAVVASSGNDQAAQLVWPAAYAGVVSVGAVDALGTQALFSNSGSGLQLTAPGYAIRTASTGGDRVLFSGTSASAPVVSGALAALLSESPGLGAIEAADILATYSNDGGVAGVDADYGRGTVNLGWALDRENAARADAAISSQAYDASAGTVSVVVQNRGAQTLDGFAVEVTAAGVSSKVSVPELAAGRSTTLSVPVDSARLAGSDALIVTSRLVTPGGFADQDTANNQQRGVVALTK